MVQAPPSAYPVKSSYIKAKFSLNTKDFTDLYKNLDVVIDSLIPSMAAEAVGEVAIDLLKHSVPRTPIYSDWWGKPYSESGRLRESGRATVLYREGKERVHVGFGKKDGGIDIDLGRLKNAQGKVRGSKRISSRVSFHRENELGEDIALWTHEELLPYIRRPKPANLDEVFVATHPRTGPKYLEEPFNQRRSTYIAFLKRVINDHSVAKAIEKMGGKKYAALGGKGRLPKFRLNAQAIPHIEDHLDSGGNLL